MFQVIGGERVNVSGDANVRETENTIRTMLGTYEEHTMTTFSQQFDITRWIDHGQTNRKELLARFLGLNIIDDLQKILASNNNLAQTYDYLDSSSPQGQEYNSYYIVASCVENRDNNLFNVNYLDFNLIIYIEGCCLIFITIV